MARVKIGNVFPSLAWLMERCAPAGYGWGEVYGRGLQNVAEVNACVTGGVYTFAGGANSSVIVVNGIEIGYANIIVAPFTDNAYTTQIMRPVVPTLDSLLIRHKSGETWGEWEWANPPMVIDVEYRTTERYKGKPVYARLVDCNGCPGAESKTIPHNTAGVVDNIVSAQGQMQGYRVFPSSVIGGSMKLDIETNATEIILHSNADYLAGTPCHVLLKYTKV